MKKLFFISSFVATIGGFILLGSGAWGIVFTYTSVAQEHITTPEDASLPNVPVRGLLTLKAQADIIRAHTLRMTEGKTFADMPRQIAKLGADGTPLVGEDGKPIMVANTARDIWITATALITALNLGIFSYAFSGALILFGFLFIVIGVAFYATSKKE